MDEGKARLKEKELSRAIEAFQKAHDIMHVPTTGIALAKAHLAAGHLVEARDAALEVGRMPRDSGEPAVFEGARKLAKELDAQLKPRIPTLRVKVKGGAATRITIDEIEIPQSIVGEPVALNPGKRVVIVKNAEGGEVRGEIELAERDAKEIELTLPSPQEHSPEPLAKRTVTSSPSNPSARALALQADGNDRDFNPDQRTALAQGLLYGGLGVGMLGLSVGGITGVMTLAKASDVEPQCENNVCAPAARDTLESANTLANISTIGFVAGAVGLAVGAVGFMLPKRASRAVVHSSISVGPNGVGGAF